MDVRWNVLVDAHTWHAGAAWTERKSRPHAAAACLPSFLPCTFELCQLLLRPEFDVAFQLVASDAAPFIHMIISM